MRTPHLRRLGASAPEARNLPVTSHGITVHHLGAVPNSSALKFHGCRLERSLAESLPLAHGRAVVPDRPGHGAKFDFDAPAAPRIQFRTSPRASPRNHQACPQDREAACPQPLRTYNSCMDTDWKDKELQDRAKALVERISLLREEDRLPLVVEFAGSPKAGKTSNIDIVTHFFKRTNFKTWGIISMS